MEKWKEWWYGKPQIPTAPPPPKPRAQSLIGLTERARALATDRRKVDKTRTSLDFDPQAQTEKERSSRVLHAQRLKDHHKVADQLFEQFLVVGLKDQEKKELSSNSFVEDDNLQVLWKYPPDSLPITAVASFCFPNGIRCKGLRRTPSNSSLYKLLCSQTVIHHSSNSFIFLLTLENGDFLYGVCVTKEESLELNPSFLEDPNSGLLKQIQNSLGKTSDIPVAPRAYCIITRCPFFSLHFDVLYGLLAMEHMNNIQMIHTINNGLYELEDSVNDAGITSHTEDIGSKRMSFGRTGPTGPEAVIKILSEYQRLTIPNPGQNLDFKSAYFPKTLSYARPIVDDEEEALCDWALPLCFYTLSRKNFFYLFAACLLEKKIVFFCTNLRILSSVVLSFIPLLRPFLYQSMIIPILPKHLYTLLEAPVPFLLGVTQVPKYCPSGVIFVDLDEGTMRNNEPLPEFPRSKEFDAAFLEAYTELKTTFSKEEKPYMTSSKQLRLSKRISKIFEKHLRSLFTRFPTACIRDLTDRNKPITIFMKESFLGDVPKSYKPFLSLFLETQMFFGYSDALLRKMDAKP